MSSSAPILTFETASRQLPAELLLLVLTHYIGTPEFVVDASKAPLYTISYKNASSPILSSLPSELVPDYHKVRVLGYKRDVKTFTSGYDFYMTHLLLSLHAKSLVPAFPIPAYCLWTTTTGAEDMRICLGEGITLPTASALVPMPRPRLTPSPQSVSTSRRENTSTSSPSSCPPPPTTTGSSLPPLKSSWLTQATSSYTSAMPSKPPTHGMRPRTPCGARRLKNTTTARRAVDRMYAIAGLSSIGYWSLRGITSSCNISLILH
ncbi:hypothetical protein PtrSN002B_002609 [Pyrenophora tritici-repentis]|nr:hypothetical protein PtrV1_02061 [Pyrenophora tritici-repentis]KAF7454798.1 hypothetical protein A1F99_020560 [Pyrenophora tritici-repentis]KAI1543643.1 hypothetical protein PtrSN001A_002994 [Pyrenophora tritici-repentis]KAI1546863.1 hypothetical protein PtrSN001C_002651 [Pyrenophora tritici-repentis]KAI1555944.1 hypothetical protein PtrSN002B_002609 [Pyrenophora tritici-repentis]